jgi:hypothetical protein
MLYTLEGKPITRVAYEGKFKERMKALKKEDYDAIVEELNKVIDTSDVHTSSWIPGHDWRGTVYEPIWRSCKENDEVAAMFYGQILYKVMIDRPEPWLFGNYPHAKGKTYFKPSQLDFVQ